MVEVKQMEFEIVTCPDCKSKYHKAMMFIFREITTCYKGDYCGMSLLERLSGLVGG